jgi:hypothetical protein
MKLMKQKNNSIFLLCVYMIPTSKWDIIVLLMHVYVSVMYVYTFIHIIPVHGSRFVAPRAPSLLAPAVHVCVSAHVYVCAYSFHRCVRECACV